MVTVPLRNHRDLRTGCEVKSMIFATLLSLASSRGCVQGRRSSSTIVVCVMVYDGNKI